MVNGGWYVFGSVVTGGFHAVILLGNFVLYTSAVSMSCELARCHATCPPNGGQMQCKTGQ
jgi:hypothetical protein